jgi:propionyl-CoA carboxylase alpha chain
MNTRLQVEHPVTELVTGIDLVEQMIRVAAGEKLPFAQGDIKLNGWAIESRLYAEDPYRNFMPSIGRLTRYQPPAEGQFGNAVVRNDTGVFEGAEISVYYDPMIAKLCTWAPTRLEAIEAMSQALDGFVVDGIEHNVPFLSALMKHPRWREGRLSTGFIAEEYPDGFAPMMPDEGQQASLAAIAMSAALIETNRRERFGDRLRSASGALREEWTVKLNEQYVDIRLVDGPVTIPFDMDMAVGDKVVNIVTDWRPGDPVWRGEVGEVSVTAQLRPILNGIRLDWQGLSVKAKVFTPRHAELDKLMPVKLPPDTSKLLLCPMPGLVVSVAVTEGQEVKAGETLAVVEAMKMENVLRAERDLTVGKINAKAGESLAVDAVIMEFA